MTFDTYPEYMTVQQAAAYLDVTPATIRRLLRQYGLGEFLRASMNKQVMLRKEDLDAMDVTNVRTGEATRSRPKRGRGAA